MLKIKYLSDLHLGRYFTNEQVYDYINNAPPQNADVLVIAGDLTHSIQKLHKYGGDDPEEGTMLDDFIKWCDESFPTTIIVPGNHEFYDGSDLEEYMKGTVYHISTNVIVADNVIIPIRKKDSTKIYYFVCSTMWSNVDEKSEQYVNTYLNDTHYINWIGEKLKANRFKDIHNVCKSFIINSLESLNKGGIFMNDVILVTHHCPTSLCERLEHIGGPLSSAFISGDMENIIKRYQPAYWIYGHTHYNKDIEIGNTKVVCNQLGYGPKEAMLFDFDKCIIIK